MMLAHPPAARATRMHWREWWWMATVTLLLGCGGRQPLGSARSQDDGLRASDPVGVACVEPEHHPLFAAWAAAPDTHSHVPNVSYAGYGAGVAWSSDSSAVRVHVTDFGAVADGSDASDAIDAAIDAVSATGGVVVLPEGDIHVRRPIFVQADRVVLRGAGKGRTRIVFERPLNEAYAVNQRSNGDSLWSWSGGLLWFAPRALRERVASPETLGDGWREGWRGDGVAVPITHDARRGDRTLVVGAGHGCSAGQRILIEVDSSSEVLEHLSGGGAFAEAQDWSLERAGWLLPPTQPTFQMPARVATVSDTTITIEQPLRMDLRRAWSPRVVGMGPVIEGSGVIGVSLVMQRSTPYDSARDHHREVGWNGVYFENAWDGFATDIDVIDSENGVLVSASKHVTVSDFVIGASQPERAAQHHATITRMGSHDVLFRDFTISAQPLHGINVEGGSMGNVWSRGTMFHGTWDTHRAMPVENVLTEMTIHNDGSPGGRADAGPRMGARHVIWNVTITNQRCGATLARANTMPSGAIVGLEGCDPGPATDSDALVVTIDSAALSPINLHDAQRACRTR